MTTSKLISSAADTVTAVVTAPPMSAVTKESPTPSSGFDVHGLCEHLLNSIHISRTAVRRESWPAGKVVVMDQPPWVKFPPELASLSAAWAAPDAIEGEVQLNGRMLPAELGAGITLMELVVHGWELARASGQTVEFDDEVLEVALAQVAGVAPSLRGRPGGFGPEVPVPAEASTLDRLVGLSGRDPHWKP
ncbi:TIGR03086 family metal-binding protein [Catellatospora tritici]|uniref:TIGR03086 family metal-binding protein n=1 Tax=Catellatospora tritici TaxID=2851566 RepID=UPI001C2DC543|nr:TIGR03086 family metal-binding protein [Catellatospora tritici]MBV1853734.1 TIGR03086 family protein [Catellatospora tritici]